MTQEFLTSKFLPFACVLFLRAAGVYGTEIVNQLADADVNYYKPDYATYLSRSDWEGTFPKTYDDLTIDGDKTDEWVQNLNAFGYGRKRQYR